MKGRTVIHSSRKLALGALVTVTALSLGACASSAPAPSGTSALPLAQQGPLRLKGVCPDTVVVQTDWTPEAEHGGIYQLLGPNPTVDADHKKVTGTLVASGQNTGISVEIRAGGPA
ncbi:MAG TPA: ABC transporter substrate-binding protein, partial [Pseudonocardiaceae bacterium]|nr:ABC transporter substrate-binding protein [Pseudonocardiaceae bacterium]